MTWALKASLLSFGQDNQLINEDAITITVYPFFLVCYFVSFSLLFMLLSFAWSKLIWPGPTSGSDELGRTIVLEMHLNASKFFANQLSFVSTAYMPSAFRITLLERSHCVINGIGDQQYQFRFLRKTPIFSVYNHVIFFDMFLVLILVFVFFTLLVFPEKPVNFAPEKWTCKIVNLA